MGADAHRYGPLEGAVNSRGALMQGCLIFNRVAPHAGGGNKDPGVDV